MNDIKITRFNHIQVKQNHLFSTEPVSVKGDMFPDQLLEKEEQKLVVVALERQISREIPDMETVRYFNFILH